MPTWHFRLLTGSHFPSLYKDAFKQFLKSLYVFFTIFITMQRKTIKRGKKIEKGINFAERMGNCIDRQRVATWVDDEEDEDWDYEKNSTSKGKYEDRDQVKIKITRKQLEELLQRGMSKEQVLVEIMSRGHVIAHEEEDSRRWRPALMSIPEVSE